MFYTIYKRFYLQQSLWHELCVPFSFFKFSVYLKKKKGNGYKLAIQRVVRLWPLVFCLSLNYKLVSKYSLTLLVQDWFSPTWNAHVFMFFVQSISAKNSEKECECSLAWVWMSFPAKMFQNNRISRQNWLKKPLFLTRAMNSALSRSLAG